jgi:hypothetical protein
MDMRSYRLVLLAATAAGFVGGALATFALKTAPVFAAGEGAPAKVIAAQQFLLQANDGSKRALLSMSPGGLPFLEFFDNRHVARAMLTVAPYSSYLLLYDEMGQNRAGLSVLPGDSSQLFLADKHRIRASLAAQEGASLLHLHAGEGQASVVAAVRPDGVPVFQLMDNNGRAVYKAH